MIKKFKNLPKLQLLNLLVSLMVLGRVEQIHSMALEMRVAVVQSAELVSELIVAANLKLAIYTEQMHAAIQSILALFGDGA